MRKTEREGEKEVPWTSKILSSRVARAFCVFSTVQKNKERESPAMKGRDANTRAARDRERERRGEVIIAERKSKRAEIKMRGEPCDEFARFKSAQGG